MKGNKGMIKLDGNTKTCFIAVTSHAYHKDVKIIKEIVTKSGYKPYVAVEKTLPNKPFFDNKIADKIKQSEFCIVILNPDKDRHGNEKPNPNVYLEYGFMCALKKEIIPLMKKDFSIASDNIHLEIVLYDDRNLKSRFEKGLKSVLQHIKGTKGKIIFDPVNIHDYNGRFLRAENHHEVFIIDEGKKRHIAHATYMSHQDWSRLEIWLPDKLDIFETGEPIHSRKTVEDILRKYPNRLSNRYFPEDYKWSSL